MHMASKTETVKVDFNFPILGLDDKPIIDERGEQINAGKFLATRLSGVSKGDIFKLMEWARKCYKGLEIELNPAERKILEEFIEGSDTFSVLTKEQLLIILK